MLFTPGSPHYDCTGALQIMEPVLVPSVSEQEAHRTVSQP